MTNRFYIFLIAFFYCSFLFAQKKDPLKAKDYQDQKHWVDSIYNSMTLKEKVGQLFVVQLMTKNDNSASLYKQIHEHSIGGVILSNGSPIKTASTTNKMQSLSKTPLLIGIDGEWGLKMRIDSTMKFPWNMSLGALKDNSFIEKIGSSIGKHCKRMGIHINFAPVVDINTNPKNPIIGNRSYGENKLNVTSKAVSFTKGLQSQGILACAKHFPGHGDTSKDSHKTLPTIAFKKKRLLDVELYPYKSLIKQDLGAVMIAHLNVPSLEPNADFPSSLSKNIVTNLLKERLKFRGLIITDALGMKGVTNYDSENIDLMAFKAGNDVLLMSGDITAGISSIVNAYNNNMISEKRLQHSVKKILKAKYKVGLNRYKPIEINNLILDLNPINDKVLKEEVVSNIITLLKNDNQATPILSLNNNKIVHIQTGSDSGETFNNYLNKYSSVDYMKISDFKTINDLMDKLTEYNTVIIGLHQPSNTPWDKYNFTRKELLWIDEISKSKNTILTIFAKPYSLNKVLNINTFKSVILSYQNDKIFQEKTAQMIFGSIPFNGVIPVSIVDEFKVGDGIKTSIINRLSYGLPESVNIDSRKLSRIDSIVKVSIDSMMTPGVQLLIAKNSKVIFDKSYGKLRYDKDNMVNSTTKYDLASLTKILVTLPLIMKLYDNNVLSIDSKLGELLPSYKESNKSEFTIKEMLSHFAYFQAWIPFYKQTIDSTTGKLKSNLYRNNIDENFSLKINNNIHLISTYKDTILNQIKESELIDERYKYSDLPYIILQQYIEDYYSENLDNLSRKYFFNSIGANSFMFNPANSISIENIAPTEIDSYFRNQEVVGYVHDMAAAMLGGVSGHAGLFGNSNDVAKIMQMYIQNGNYGGIQYLKPETINTFNTCNYCSEGNRRGIGFDKPQLEDEGPTCGCVSMNSFGHSGWTGTYAWADPDEEIVYIFLSNRSYPNDPENKLLNYNIRTEIQRLLYESINR
jgi:beta-glucosidase-like glycosyl hydrolase/CubicO group peptidase (beta-lactamase class C family)